ncbi:hypothetical protein BOTCAL_0445g00060 [Botryotinia calthae]|uniref:Uncharacterized protein n=1 Tax=Botryotinia calthae TaxID=38488 RepID=A0A4Y8CQ26_9HELO|nr:hypothetical protein BOTCAL_0445g00060 [Botryotinia calthae]
MDTDSSNTAHETNMVQEMEKKYQSTPRFATRHSVTAFESLRHSPFSILQLNLPIESCLLLE